MTMGNGRCLGYKSSQTSNICVLSRSEKAAHEVRLVHILLSHIIVSERTLYSIIVLDRIIIWAFEVEFHSCRSVESDAKIE